MKIVLKKISDKLKEHTKQNCCEKYKKKGVHCLGCPNKTRTSI